MSKIDNVIDLVFGIIGAIIVLFTAWFLLDITLFEFIREW